MYVDLHLCQKQANLPLEETSRSFISQQYCVFNCACALWVLTLAVLYHYCQLISMTKTQCPMTSISVFPHLLGGFMPQDAQGYSCNA